MSFLEDRKLENCEKVNEGSANLFYQRPANKYPGLFGHAVSTATA